MVVGGGKLDQSEYGAFGAYSYHDPQLASSSSLRTRQQKKALLLLVSVTVAVVVLVAMVTNVHRNDPNHNPVELVAAAAKSVKTAKSVASPIKSKAAPRALTTEEKIESVLRSNLDKTVAHMEKSQLQPLLLKQGQQVLHNGASKLKPAVSVGSVPGIKDLHAALVHHQSERVQKDRTESALRKQLDAETALKEKQLLEKSLKMVQQQSNKASKLAGSSGSGQVVSEDETEKQLKAELDAKLKAKEKTMYKKAFNNWLEKQQAVKIQKVKKQVTIAVREKQLFKATLNKAKKEGPAATLHHDMEHQKFEMERHQEVPAAERKPSFQQWLKAFKAQLARRTEEADKKITESRYMGKKVATTIVKSDKVTAALDTASKRRMKAQNAIKLLNKSLKMEQQEEKQVHNAEEDESTPGKALAALQKTMKQEREALKTISEAEQGAGADPNLAAIAPKAQPKEHDSGLLGLDDLGYI